MISIIDILAEMENDDTIPKNMRVKIRGTINCLEQSNDCTIIDKAIQELDCLADDPGLPVYAKTQIWNAVSILESRQ